MLRVVIIHSNEDDRDSNVVADDNDEGSSIDMTD
jgi:hypothetical protein